MDANNTLEELMCRVAALLSLQLTHSTGLDLAVFNISPYNVINNVVRQVIPTANLAAVMDISDINIWKPLSSSVVDGNNIDITIPENSSYPLRVGLLYYMSNAMAAVKVMNAFNDSFHVFVENESEDPIPVVTIQT